MYQIDDYVVKINIGLCHVKDIVHLDGRNIDKKVWYYLLVPMSDDKAKIYVPTQPEPASIRKVINSEEAWALIKEISDIQEVDIKNEKQREQEYKEAIRSGDPKRWI